MKRFNLIMYISLGLFMCLVLGISSLHTVQTELALLCDKFNEDITLPEGQQCDRPIALSRTTFTFINRQKSIMVYEYIRLDPTRRVEPRTRVWFDFISIRPVKGCDLPSTFDKWRMVIWLTPKERVCYQPVDG